jgi:hypothetical protein
LAPRRPNKAEPIRRKPSDMLAVSTDLGERLTTFSELRPYNIMAVTSYPFPWPNVDRCAGTSGPAKADPRSRTEPLPARIMVSASQCDN